MNPPRQVLRGLGELVAYIPYLLGFHPTDSIVVLGGSDEGVGPTARFDVVEDQEGQRELIDLVSGQMARSAPAWHDVVLFGDSEVGRAMLERVRSALHPCAPVKHVLVVHAATAVRSAHWSVLQCACGRRCAEGEWLPVPPDSAIAAVADQVLAGSSPAPDREALAASLERRPLVSAAVERYVTEAYSDEVAPSPVDYAAALLAVFDLTDGAPAVPDLPIEALAAVLEGWRDRNVRDHAMSWLVPATFEDLDVCHDIGVALILAGGAPIDEGDTSPERDLRMRERLRSLVTCAPPALGAAPATVLAFWCWTHGGGAMAGLALEHALSCDPDYRMAQLLAKVLDAGLRPSDLHPITREVA